uniref:VLIG-type G domain-containing protein n=1 Tax=Leptobrachium leishanense TaxID=445787 RepID=A0A8C5QW23_9ANUR
MATQDQIMSPAAAEASAAGALGTVVRMKRKLLEVFGEAPNCLLDELTSLIPEPQEENLKSIENKTENIEKILDMIIERGEPACEQFLGELKNMLSQFPELSKLSCDLTESHNSQPSSSPQSLHLQSETIQAHHSQPPPSPQPLHSETIQAHHSQPSPSPQDLHSETIQGQHSQPSPSPQPLTSETIQAHHSQPSPSPQSLPSETIQDKIRTFEEFLAQLGMKTDLNSKLTMKSILNIGKERIKDIDPQKIEDLPWHFLMKLMALNRNARNTQCKMEPSSQASSDGGDESDNMFDSEYNDLYTYFNSTAKSQALSSLHPLDVLCALLHCSDHFLQQEIVSKMSMCQFSVPLLLPAGDGTNCTLMLWAMRDIVKRWRPHSLAGSKGFIEDNVVNVDMPAFSFVRLGKTKLSKSKILNQVLSQAQQHQDFFIHDNMQGGNSERKISNGLVEMSWYFPSGSGSSDIFPEPIMVANLRGDLESNWNQFSFLTRVSSAVFIFTEGISERELRILSNCNLSDTKYYLVISPNPGKEPSREDFLNLQKCMSLMKIENNNLVLKRKTDNDTVLVEKIKSLIKSCLIHSPDKVNFQDRVKEASEFAIDVDENSESCRKAREYVQTITKEINNVVQYKKETMTLQGDLWKEVSQIEKEMCRMKKQGGKDAQEYQSDLIRQLTELKKEQNKHKLPSGIKLFIDAFVDFSQSQKHYFLKWMKMELDSVARRSLFNLQIEYKEKCNKKEKNKEELKQLDQKISDSSLGIEHFLREMGQFYEAECLMFKKKIIQENQRHYSKLPGIAADLLLDGFPLELIDGDASNIPLQWITDVLEELNTKTGERCRMRVITVLGVQSTGKSTLLNTMFGLQFPVASGRCTRGAFMTLLRVEEIFIEELHCDYILVIDTEGLKAPELASLEDSYEHDNELATLVIGLSDITIINMAMENTTEMKDILQIVVHAFLRMKEIGRTPSCHFVHQNVSDVSAHEKNMRDRKKLLEQLDEMTKTAADMEKKCGITTFNSIMNYDIEKNSWYIPGLWHGVPPMAPVNYGYSENVAELKKYLFEFLKSDNIPNKPYNIKEFIIWIESLWKAVKHEKFIFSFRNSLVAQAYNKLTIQFSQWEWDFTKDVYSWVSKTETQIKNQSSDTSHTEALTGYKDELGGLLFKRQEKMKDLLQKYFESDSENVHLIERYKEDFFRSVEFLKEELERNAIKKCHEALNIQKGRIEIQSIESKYQGKIESKVINLLQSCREKNRQLSDRELEKEFDTMWKTTISDLQIKPLICQDINRAILQQLRKNMNRHGSNINGMLQNVKDLKGYAGIDFKMDSKYIDTTVIKRLYNTVKKLLYGQEHNDKVSQFAGSIMELCERSVQEKVCAKWDYNESHFKELLGLIDDKLKSKEGEDLHVNTEFELHIKLLISGRAAAAFQKMHKDFIQENDPYICLNRLKPQYFLMFKCIYQKKDQSQQRAKQFCDLCLKPALTEYINRHLGQEIVDDVLNSSDNMKFKSRSDFQAAVLKDLLEKDDFQEYVKYTRSYESFSKSWIHDRIWDKYEKSSKIETLQIDLLSVIVKKTKDVLKGEKCLKSNNAVNLLRNMCEELKSELVIKRNLLNMVQFGNTADVGQFSGDIQTFLIEVEKQIISEIKSTGFHSVLSKVTLNPVDELLKKVIGCGKQCPFCKVPCEAGGADHKEHSASIHRPQGLGTYRNSETEVLWSSICSTDVVSNNTFANSDTGLKYYPYKEYRTFYPNWSIQPDASIESSDYWKSVFVRFNNKFAEEYEAKPAALPYDWNKITKEQALRSLEKVFNVRFSEIEV